LPEISCRLEISVRFVKKPGETSCSKFLRGCPVKVYFFTRRISGKMPGPDLLLSDKKLTLQIRIMKPALSIVIPAFEEEARLGGSVRKVLDFIKEEKLDAELIIVDDGSRDRTSEIAEDVCLEFPGLEARLIRYQQNRGKGYAVKTGLLAARADIALFSDADLSTPISELYKLIEPIRKGEYDLTFGSRALDRSLIGVHQPWRREQGGKVFNFIVRMLTGLPFWDTQCGFKAFNMKRFRPLLDLMRIDRFGFDVEFLYVAQLHGLKLKEIPVRWDHDERTKVNVFRDSQRMFNEVRQIRKNARRGLYKLAETTAAEETEAARKNADQKMLANIKR
jgi:dolichyl-phosphate beta-glucosyltransferase